MRWRRVGYTKWIEMWMEIQKNGRIYELGSLSSFLLVFAGHMAPIEHRWRYGVAVSTATGGSLAWMSYVMQGNGRLLTTRTTGEKRLLKLLGSAT